MPVSLVWFRQDLRLADNPALTLAAQRGTVVPVYIDCSAEEGPWPPGGASRWWLHQSLQRLDATLRDRNSRLCMRQGPASAVLRELCAETGADAVFWNRRYEPVITARDASVKSELRAAGLIAESRNAALLVEPWEIANQSGKPFRVFTPFWRALLKQYAPAAPLPVPAAQFAFIVARVVAAGEIAPDAACCVVRAHGPRLVSRRSGRVGTPRSVREATAARLRASTRSARG